MCNCEFYDKEPSEAFDFFDQLAENTKQWETSLSLHVESRNTISHSSGKFQLKETDDLNARLASLARKVESLEIKKVHVMSEKQEESLSEKEGEINEREVSEKGDDSRRIGVKVSDLEFNS